MAAKEEIAWTYEPGPRKRGADWFWIVGIVAVGGTVAAILLGNVLFAVVIGLSGITLIMVALRPPLAVEYGVSARGVRVNDRIYPFQSLDSYFIEYEEPATKLRLKSKHFFTPLLSIPLPDEITEEVEQLVAVRLPEENLEEPFAYRVLEFFGF